MRVKIVDGFRIRNTLDIEFSMVADRDTFPYVPKGEIWLERYYVPERAEVLARFLLKRRLAKRHGYERAKAMMRPAFSPSDVAGCRLRRLGRRGGAALWLVRGKAVRRLLDPS
ncbi:MAG: hypothetical protein RL272_1242, partial [Candidatus Parcubacteria bacterium]